MGRLLLWEDTLQRAAKAMNIALEQLPVQRSAPAKVSLAAAMKRATSVSNAWLAERLQMGAPASVSQYVRRFGLQGGFVRRDFKSALSKITT